MDEKGVTRPTGGTLAVFDPPSGPGVRVDSFGYSGYETSAAFDSLLAKVIVHSPAASWADVVQKAARALREFRIAGVATNIAFIPGGAGASRFRRQPHQRPISSIATSPRWSAQRGRSRDRYSLPPADAAARNGRIFRRRQIDQRSGGITTGGCALARHNSCDRGFRRGYRSPGTADRRPRIDEDGAPGDRAARRQGHENSRLQTAQR